MRRLTPALLGILGFLLSSSCTPRPLVVGDAVIEHCGTELTDLVRDAERGTAHGGSRPHVGVEMTPKQLENLKRILLANESYSFPYNDPVGLVRPFLAFQLFAGTEIIEVSVASEFERLRLRHESRTCLSNCRPGRRSLAKLALEIYPSEAEWQKYAR
jgi:hypothetical protein